MNNIIVIDNDKNFIISLQNMINILELPCNLQVNNLDKNINYNYLILNNIKNDKALRNISKHKFDYILLNMDQKSNNMCNISGNIITYGFGNKNTITVSSVEKDNGNFIYCIQRYIKNNEYVLEPQEIPIVIPFINKYELYASIVAVTIAMIEGKSLSNVERNLKKYIFR